MKRDYHYSPGHSVLWDTFDMSPTIQTQAGEKKIVTPLMKKETGQRDTILFTNDFIELRGVWDNTPGFASKLSLSLTNTSKSLIRVNKLCFPSENGFDYILRNFKPKKVSFFQNGYQSWTATRSYRMNELPLRSWFNLSNEMSENMNNLASNVRGDLCSEMFTVVTDLELCESFLVGQSMPFNQLFYIRLALNEYSNKKAFFQITYDLGRKMMAPGETIELDAIILGKGDALELKENYFNYLGRKSCVEMEQSNPKGWCTWYCFFNQITPEKIYQNINRIKELELPLEYIQIDDGYEKNVGDWLELIPEFNGKMNEVTDKIRKAGFKPAIWIAPFIADKKSKLYSDYPEFILRTDDGKPVDAGINPVWPGFVYYSLDVTNPFFVQYIQEVIRTITYDWGFDLLKLDFMYSACMSTGRNMNFRLSRAELLKEGMDIIRKAAKPGTEFLGCGMPLSPALGSVGAMRVGNDTAPYWSRLSGFFLQSTAMVGARNSLRNLLTRSMMNKKLWVNDPDCFMVRDKNTRLNAHERKTDINAKLLAGGVVMLSDDFSELEQHDIELARRILKESGSFYHESAALDVMEREMPSIFYNRGGYIGFFNFENGKKSLSVNLRKYERHLPEMRKLVDFWTNEEIKIPSDAQLSFPDMPAHSSRLFKIVP